MPQFHQPYILAIVTPTKIIDLTRHPFSLIDWTPGTPEYKGGGVFQDSTIADGRSLVRKQWTNVVEGITFEVATNTPDDVRRAIQDLRRALEEAALYHTNEWASQPVYLMAQDERESNIRYATIISGRVASDVFPFALTMRGVPARGRSPQRAVTGPVTMGIEHALWQDVIPGTSTATTITSELFSNSDDFANGQMENWSGGNPTSWTSNNSPTITQSSAIRYSGKYSAQITKSSGTAGIYQQVAVSVYPGYTGAVRATARAYVSSGTATLGVYNAGGFTNGVTDSTAQQGWVELTVDNVIPAATGARIYLSVTDGDAYFDDVQFGPVRGAADLSAVPVGSSYSGPVLTHVWNYDNSGASFSTNYAGVAAFTMLPASTAVGDYIVFGSENYFNCLIFDIGTGASATTSYTITWEYSTGGGAWSTLTATDNTSSFATTGLNGVHWVMPSNWATNTVNGIALLCVRARVSALTGTFTQPTNQNRPVYAILPPFFDVSAPSGDIRALMKVTFENISGGANTPTLDTARLYMGTRSLSRGKSFSAYIPLSNGDGLPPGVSVTAGTGMSMSAGVVPTGGVVDGTTTLNTWVEAATVTLDQSVAWQYTGAYKALLVASETGTGDYRIRLDVLQGSGATAVQSRTAISLGTRSAVIDLGRVSLSAGAFDSTELQVWLRRSGAGAITLIRLVLLPVDEFALTATGSANNTQTDSLVVDGAESYRPRADFFDSDLLRKERLILDANGSVAIPIGSDSRVWILMAGNDGTEYIAPDATAALVSVSLVAQYFSNRGNR